MAKNQNARIEILEQQVGELRDGYQTLLLNQQEMGMQMEAIMKKLDEISNVQRQREPLLPIPNLSPNSNSPNLSKYREPVDSHLYSKSSKVSNSNHKAGKMATGESEEHRKLSFKRAKVFDDVLTSHAIQNPKLKELAAMHASPPVVFCSAFCKALSPLFYFHRRTAPSERIMKFGSIFP